eukprot:m.58796 g.58796  ORF g.58796 m.58796 type:complete len:647 (-) comp13793_c0_seq1:68-2008(-)
MIDPKLRQRLLVLSLLWMVAIFILNLFGHQDRTTWLFNTYDQLKTIYEGTAVAFCFAIVLDILAYQYAVNNSKKALALVLTVVDTIACLSYVCSASMPLYYFFDEFDNPVWVVRYAEWMVTCPLLLVIVALAASAPMDQMLDLVIWDTCLNTLGLLSSVIGGKLGLACFGLASLIFVMLLWRVSQIIQDSTVAGRKPLAPRPALRLLHLEIIVSWSVFPAIELMRRYGGLDYQTGEALNCINDGAAKVGLALILFSCNLDSYMARDATLRTALGDVLMMVTKTGVETSSLAVLDELDDDVKAWFNQQYGNVLPVPENERMAPSWEARTLEATMAAPNPSSSIEQWDFSTLHMASDELVKVSVRMLDQLSLLRLYGIEKPAMVKFVKAVAKAYRDVPYHNFANAVQGLHFAYLFIRKAGLAWGRDLEVLALALAALLRNVGHAGLTNGFHVRARTELALTYNDTSVVQQAHCSKAFQLLLDSKTGLLSHFDQDTVAELRTLMISFILSTDPTKHQAQLSALQQVKAGSCSVPHLETDPDLRRLLLTSVARTCDMACSLQPFHLAQAWARRLQSEYNRQAEQETALGLTPEGYLTKKLDLHIAQAQVMDTTLIVRPWIEQLSDLLPSFDYLIDNLDDNLSKWQEAAEL